MTPLTHQLYRMGLSDAESSDSTYIQTGRSSNRIGGVMTPPYIWCVVINHL